MATIKDVAQDLVKTVISTGFFEKIKVDASTNGVVIEAMDNEREVILKGSFNAPLTELTGAFGLSNLSLLSHITSDPEFTHKDSDLSIVYKKDSTSGDDVPTEFAYTNKSKSYINYRFMPQQLVPAQPKFIEPSWDVVITPTKSNIQQFGWAANGLSQYEQYFIPKIKDGQLKFFIGDDNAASQRGGVVFAADRTEKFDGVHKWKIGHIMSVLKLADSTDCEMAFSTKGAIQITVKSGVGAYRYIFPAKVN
jgi:hypothetical protein